MNKPDGMTALFSSAQSIERIFDSHGSLLQMAAEGFALNLLHDKEPWSI